MTRKEAIKYAESKKAMLEAFIFRDDCAYGDYAMYSTELSFVNAVLTALRPVSRNQVETVWRGKWNVSYDELNGFTYVTCSKCGDETVLNGCFVTTEGEPCGLEDFCPACGAPMTDEAVDIRLKELEALNGGR